MLEIQRILQNNKIEDIIEEFGLRSDKRDGRILLSYSQIDSPKGVEAVKECRGLILEEGSWKVLSYPFKRFFNHGEVYAEPVNWDTAQVYEKLDGSLTCMWHDRGQWYVQTRGMMYADGLSYGWDKTFAEIFWSVLPDKSKFDPKYCYMFELTTRYNKVVKRYDEDKVWLIGARHLDSLKEVDQDNLDSIAKEANVDRPKVFGINTIEDCVKIAESFPADEEGFVIVDNNFNRIKVKNPKYVALNHIRDKMGPKWLIEIAKKGECDEILAYYPEYTDDLRETQKILNGLKSEINQLWEANKNKQTQKDFALSVRDHPLSGILFQLRAGRLESIDEGVSNVDSSKLLNIITNRRNNDSRGS